MIKKLNQTWATFIENSFHYFLTMIDFNTILQNEETLDPVNWQNHKDLAHKMIDDVFEYLSTLREQKVWTKTPDKTINSLKSNIPENGSELSGIYEDFKQNILPYRKGSIHPMFFSWVEGNGTITGVLADMLASTMNSNNAIGDHAAVYVEHQVLNWCKEIVGYPENASGVLVGGGSIANITGLIVARNSFRDGIIKKEGLKSFNGQLVMYCSTETHNCIFKAAEAIGIGSDFLKKVPVNDRYEIDLELLKQQISMDRANGLVPFCIVGNVGTVNTGAIDPIMELYNICRSENLWLHIDGAIGAVLKLVPEYAEKIKGMELADSIAFDLHKWMYVNYEAGCILIKNAELHKNAFVQKANYLSGHERGLAAGPESFSHYGLDLSRNFKSLKVWMNIREHGINKYARLIKQNIAQAFYMQSKILLQPHLELLTPVNLNIVCYRYNPGARSIDELNVLNKEILMTMQDEGIAAPSYTILKGQYAIRLSITNHRTKASDLDLVLEATVKIGKNLIRN